DVPTRVVRSVAPPLPVGFVRWPLAPPGWRPGVNRVEGFPIPALLSPESHVRGRWPLGLAVVPAILRANSNLQRRSAASRRPPKWPPTSSSQNRAQIRARSSASALRSNSRLSHAVRRALGARSVHRTPPHTSARKQPPATDRNTLYPCQAGGPAGQKL